MKNSRKLFIIIEAVLAAGVIVLVFIMFSERNRDDFHKVSVIVQNSDSHRWAAFRYGLKMAAEDKEIELAVVSTSDAMTAEEQLNAIKREIDSGAEALLVQPVAGYDTEQQLKKLEKKIPIMLVGHTASKEREDSLLPVTEPDYYAMGKALAQELLKDYDGKINGKTFGIVSENSVTEAALNCRKGFLDGLGGTGADIAWSVSGFAAQDAQRALQAESRVDFVIALDDASLTAAGECSAASNLHGALVYGIGNSMESVYYLDTGMVECLAVPDAFQAGYQSLTQAAERLEHFFYRMENRTVDYTVIRRDELFTKKNQEMIFTMSQ